LVTASANMVACWTSK